MRIMNLDTLPFSVPLAPPPGGSAHPLGAGFLTYCLVRAETDSGLVGWGEVSDGWGCEYAEVAGALVREALTRFVVGQNPLDVSVLVQRMFAWLRRRQGAVWLVAQAISGVELALNLQLIAIPESATQVANGGISAEAQQAENRNRDKNARRQHIQPRVGNQKSQSLIRC